MKSVRHTRPRPGGMSDSETDSDDDYGGGIERTPVPTLQAPEETTAVGRFGIGRGRGAIPQHLCRDTGSPPSPPMVPGVRSGPRGRGRARVDYGYSPPAEGVNNQVRYTEPRPQPRWSEGQWGRNSGSRPSSGSSSATSVGVRSPNRPVFKFSNNKTDSKTDNQQKIGPPTPEPVVSVVHSATKVVNTVSENLNAHHSTVNSQTSPSLHVPFLNAEFAPNYSAIHAMTKRDQIESIPNLDTAMAEISYRIIKQAWNTARTEDLLNQCKNAYMQSDHPFSLGLFFMLRSFDFANPMGNRNLCTSVIVELQKFLGNSKNWKSQLTHDIQKLAFHLVLTYRKLDLKRLITEVFKLKEIKDELIEDIKLLSKQGLFKQALAGSLVLEVFSFDIHTFLLPMILQDKLIYVEEYFENKGARHLLVNTISYLDQLVASNRSIGNWWYNYAAERNMDTKTILVEKLNSRTLTKLVKRFCSKYNVDSSSIPHITKRNAVAALRHILWRRFSEDSPDMTDENFQDIVAGLIKDDYTLTEEAMYQIKINAGMEYAIEFAKLHSVPHEWLPCDVLQKLENAPIQIDQSFADEDWEMDQEPTPTSSHRLPPAASYGQEIMNDDISREPLESTVALPEKINPTEPQSCSNVSYYTLPFGLEKVKMVTTLEDFQFFHEHLRKELAHKEIVFVGVDAEWKPVQSKSAALLQLAFHSFIFLVDLLNLGKMNYNGVSPFEILLSEFFASEKIIKLGYDFRNDFTMLCGVSTHWSTLREKSRSILDLRTLEIEIKKRHVQFFPFSEITSDKGLKELVQICFNKSLDKAMQFSDWERRPLRKNQIVYAAADAYVLIEILDLITERDKTFPVRLDGFIKACQKPVLSIGQNLQKLKVPIEVIHAVFAIDDTQPHPTPARTVNSVEILCDQMLEGLGRLLRCFGLNTVMIGKTGAHSELTQEELIASATANGAFIITRSKNRYTEFLMDFPLDKVLYVKSDVYVDQVVEVCRYFKIALERQYCHTVCFYCNNSVFINASKPFIQNLVERRGYKKSKLYTQQALEKVTQIIPPEMIINIGENKRNWVQLLLDEAILIRPSEDRIAGIAFTTREVPIQIKVPPHLVDSYIDEFYICNSCGAFYYSSKVIEDMIYTKQQSSSTPENPGQ